MRPCVCRRQCSFVALACMTPPDNAPDATSGEAIQVSKRAWQRGYSVPSTVPVGPALALSSDLLPWPRIADQGSYLRSWLVLTY